jgi:hypothetical protein
VPSPASVVGRFQQPQLPSRGNASYIVLKQNAALFIIELKKLLAQGQNTLMVPIAGFVVNGALMDASTTNKFCIPITFVSASTHDSSLQLLLQCCTLPSVYGLYVLTQVVSSSTVEFFAMLSGESEAGSAAKMLWIKVPTASASRLSA